MPYVLQTGTSGTLEPIFSEVGVWIARIEVANLLGNRRERPSGAIDDRGVWCVNNVLPLNWEMALLNHRCDRRSSGPLREIDWLEFRCTIQHPFDEVNKIIRS